MAVRTDTLKKVGIGKVWENAVSDDLSMNSALRLNRYRALFLPQCTVATYNQTTRTEFLTWATRQVVLTKAFHRKLWNYGLAAYVFLSLTVLLAIISIGCTLAFSPFWLLPALLLLTPSGLGVLGSNRRISTFKRALAEFASDFEKNRRADAIASLIVPWIMTYCIIKSARMKEIEWRGRTYQLTG